jgi:hypothetical protein
MQTFPVPDGVYPDNEASLSRLLAAILLWAHGHSPPSAMKSTGA